MILITGASGGIGYELFKNLSIKNEVIAISNNKKLENNEKGIALFVIAKTNECFHAGLSKIRYFFLNKIGIKTNEAIVNLAWTNPIAPNSGAATFIKIKALPHTAPRKVKTTQYLNSIIK